MATNLMTGHFGMRPPCAAVLTMTSLALATLLGGCVVGHTDHTAPVPATASAAPPDSNPDRGRGDSRPNIVVVMADDMRADDLRFMPRVRRLIGARGLHYRNSFSPAPLCCPARASFFTGQYPHNHGVLSNVSPWGFGSFDDRRTLATSLHRAGYQTGLVGKYLNGYGIDHARVTGRRSLRYVPAGWSDWCASVDLPRRSRLGGGTYDYFDPVFNVNGRIRHHYRGQYQTAVVGRFARVLARRYAASGRPFFLYFAPLAPHTARPVEADDDLWARGPGGELTHLGTPARPRWVRGKFNREVTRGPGMPASGASPESDVSDKPPFLQLPPVDPLESAALTVLTRQRAEALYVLDQEVAKLVATLQRASALKNTVIMFTSDNGYFLGEHRFRFAKTLSYEPAMRVPLLIAGPGVPHGTRFAPAQTLNLSATIVDLARARPPHAADGLSLVPTFSRDRGWASPIVTEGIPDPTVPPRPDPRSGFADARTETGVRTARYQLTRWISGELELYDLRRDPNEHDNRAYDPRYAGTLERLTRVWWHFTDCRGSACTRSLPGPLIVGARQLRSLTLSQAAGVRAHTGISW